MRDIHYYPLVNADSDGSVKVPMFQAENEKAAKAHHRFYLMEVVPTYYRLMSTAKLSNRKKDSFAIRCPKCGKALKAISPPLNENKRGLYECPKCKKY